MRTARAGAFHSPCSSASAAAANTVATTTDADTFSRHERKCVFMMFHSNMTRRREGNAKATRRARSTEITRRLAGLFPQEKGKKAKWPRDRMFPDARLRNEIYLA